MVGLYMDECVHGAISRGLLRRRVDVLTTQEDGRASAPDAAVLDRATTLGRVVFTNDPDLLEEAFRRQADGQPFSGVVYAHALTPIGVCVRDLELLAGCSEAGEWANQVLHLPL